MTRRSIVIFGIVPGLVIAIAGLTLNYVIEWSYPSGASPEESLLARRISVLIDRLARSPRLPWSRAVFLFSPRYS